jgi:hypothetical protein
MSAIDDDCHGGDDAPELTAPAACQSETTKEGTLQWAVRKTLKLTIQIYNGPRYF